MLLHLDANRFWQSVKRRDLIERRFVERATHQPAFIAITVEVALAKVLQPDQPFRQRRENKSPAHEFGAR